MKRYYKKGDIIQMSSGKYSDYCIGPVYRVREDFDLKAVAESVPKDNDSLVRNDSAVLIAIYNAGRLEEIEHTELWIGAYGEHYEWEFDE